MKTRLLKERVCTLACQKEERQPILSHLVMKNSYTVLLSHILLSFLIHNLLIISCYFSLKCTHGGLIVVYTNFSNCW